MAIKAEIIVITEHKLLKPFIISISPESTLADLGALISPKVVARMIWINQNEIVASSVKIKDIPEKPTDKADLYFYVSTRPIDPNVPIISYVPESVLTLLEDNVFFSTLIDPSYRPTKTVPSAPRNSRVDVAVKDGWSCKICTVINSRESVKCSVCDCELDINIPSVDELVLEEKPITVVGENHPDVWQCKACLTLNSNQSLNCISCMENGPGNGNTIAKAEIFTCPKCEDEILEGEGLVLDCCLESICKGCLLGHIKGVKTPRVPCPMEGCEGALQHFEIKSVLSDDDFNAFLRSEAAQIEGVNQCKTENCEYAFFVENGSGLKKVDCPLCKKTTCLVCDAQHEGVECAEFQHDLKRLQDRINKKK